MCNKTDNSQEQTDETVKYFGFLLYLLAWYASTRKKKKKKHFLFMTIITIVWLTHNKTKIKDEKGTWQCWALLVVLAYNKHNKLSFMSFTHERITCMMSHLPERHWGNKNDGLLKKVTAVTSCTELLAVFS